LYEFSEITSHNFLNIQKVSNAEILEYIPSLSRPIHLLGLHLATCQILVSESLQGAKNIKMIGKANHVVVSR